MKFSKEILRDLCTSRIGETIDGLTLVQNEFLESSRWSLHYTMIFKNEADGKFYLSGYSEGATESQDESPYEYDGDEIECFEVVPQEVTVTKYVKAA